MRVSRRSALVGATAATAALAAGCGEDSTPVPPTPDVEPGRVVTGAFDSVARGQSTGWALAYPPGSDVGAALPLAVFLHGRYQSHRTAFGSGAKRLGLDRYLAALVRRGGTPFAIAAVDGGDSYWHPRGDGEDAGAMVVDELLPMLADRGLRAGTGDRIALTGLSMGGYGALRLTGLLGPDRVGAVAVMSPALWTDPSAASRAGFADDDEYRRFTVFGHQADLADVPVRIDCGIRDPFAAATRAYAADLPASSHPVLRFESGAHDLAFWRSQASKQLGFVAAHL